MPLMCVGRCSEDWGQAIDRLALSTSDGFWAGVSVRVLTLLLGKEKQRLMK